MSTVTAPKEGPEREPAVVRYRKRLSVRHTLKIVLRNGAYAAIGRILFGLVKLAAKKGLGRTFWRRVSDEFLSLNPLKWSVVFGGISSFRLVMQLLSQCSSVVDGSDKIAALLAGCICSLPAVVMNNDTQTELCLYALVRALHTFSLRYVYPKLPESLQNFGHYDTAIMCASAFQISYGCFSAPTTMPRGYYSFLVKASTYDVRFLRGHGVTFFNQLSPGMVEYCRDIGAPLYLDGTTSLPTAQELCTHAAHPGYSCNAWALHFIFRNMINMGLPLYGPLKVVATLAMQRKRLIAHPRRTITRGVRSVIISSLFLALYIACIVRACCFCLHRGFRGGFYTAAFCSLAGFATLLEPKGRRMDLALYCAMYGIRSFVLTQNRLGRLPYPRHWFIFATYLASMSFLFYEYETEPQTLNSRVRSAFRMLLGEKTPAMQPHRHDDRRTPKDTNKSRSPALVPTCSAPTASSRPMDKLSLSTPGTSTVAGKSRRSVTHDDLNEL